MMINKINISLVVIALALFLVPAVSFGQAGAGVDAGVDINATTTNVDTETDVDVDSNFDSNVEVGNEAETQANSNADANADAEANLGVNSRGVTVVSSSQVDSEEDLEVFSNNASMRNKGVANVDINSGNDTDNRVRVTYNHRARFLGFIPVNIKSTTEVEAGDNGEVEVRSRLPWWSFMASGVSDIRSNIESKVSNNNEVRANTSVNASAAARARVAEAVIAELDIRANTEAEASINN